jgi:hypothetical protein
LILYLIPERKKRKKSSSAAAVQNWTPRRRRTREVCDFLDTSSGHAISTYNQPNLESTQDQPSFFRLKFWAQVFCAMACIPHLYYIMRQGCKIHSDEIILKKARFSAVVQKNVKTDNILFSMPCHFFVQIYHPVYYTSSE